MQFKKEIIEAKQQLEDMGWQVFTPELSEKSVDYTKLTKEEQRIAKQTFIRNHFNRIAQSSAILVLNYPKKGIDGYVGSNTLMEIGVATYLGKTVYILNELADQGCKEEVMALVSIIVNGNLRNLKL
jgi:nucleoside 2-deoxyribosyltransferase